MNYYDYMLIVNKNATLAACGPEAPHPNPLPKGEGKEIYDLSNINPLPKGEGKEIYDLLIIGGGINGTGIAADAAGRGLSVCLCEQNDLASGTSSASSKLIHGGLRYLEQGDFSLVKQALKERDVLLRKAPHLITPLQFYLPYHTGLRPFWMIRLGLFLYDHLYPEMHLPASKVVCQDYDFMKPLKSAYHQGFTFSDCWVDDARLTLSNALAAAEKHALINTYTEVVSFKCENGLWQVETYDKLQKTQRTYRAKALVNATGPWINRFANHSIKKVKGSHLVIAKKLESKTAYLIQNTDKRIVFIIPFESDFTLIGTTEVDFEGSPSDAKISAEEIDYLLSAYNHYFQDNITSAQIIWKYAGVRPLIYEHKKSNSEISRGYRLELEEHEQAPLLSIYGGKITTYRTLAEAALQKLQPYFPHMGPSWTHQAYLPGGDLNNQDWNTFIQSLKNRYHFLSETELTALARRYGSRIEQLLNGAQQRSDLGEYYGSGCFAAELEYSVQYEWTQTAEDFLYRRTKLGIMLSNAEKNKIKRWFDEPAHIESMVK